MSCGDLSETHTQYVVRSSRLLPHQAAGKENVDARVVQEKGGINCE